MPTITSVLSSSQQKQGDIIDNLKPFGNEPRLQSSPIVRLNDIQKTLDKDTTITKSCNGLLTSSQATETIIIPQW